MVEALRQHKIEQNKEKLLLGSGYQDFGLVFAIPNGHPVNPFNLSRREFKSLLKKAGLPNVRFHDLRHTHATVLFEQNVHPKIVSERLGHSSISITLDTYSHVLPGIQEAAAQAFDDALFTPRDDHKEQKKPAQ